MNPLIKHTCNNHKTLRNSAILMWTILNLVVAKNLVAYHTLISCRTAIVNSFYDAMTFNRSVFRMLLCKWCCLHNDIRYALQRKNKIDINCAWFYLASVGTMQSNGKFKSIFGHHRLYTMNYFIIYTWLWLKSLYWMSAFITIAIAFLLRCVSVNSLLHLVFK